MGGRIVSSVEYECDCMMCDCDSGDDEFQVWADGEWTDLPCEADVMCDGIPAITVCKTCFKYCYDCGRPFGGVA